MSKALNTGVAPYVKSPSSKVIENGDHARLCSDLALMLVTAARVPEGLYRTTISG
jgi:hypothetical protein